MVTHQSNREAVVVGLKALEQILINLEKFDAQIADYPHEKIDFDLLDIAINDYERVWELLTELLIFYKQSENKIYILGRSITTWKHQSAQSLKNIIKCLKTENYSELSFELNQNFNVILQALIDSLKHMIIIIPKMDQINV